MSEIKSIDVYREEALPGSLAPDSMYFIKVSGENFGKLFQTNNDGTITATMVGMRPRGDYSGLTAYTTGDLALNQASTWIALQGGTGNAPPTLPTTSNAYWQLVAQGGIDGVGEGGIGLTVNEKSAVESLSDIAITTYGGSPSNISTGLAAFRDAVGNAGATVTFGKISIPQDTWLMPTSLGSTTQGLHIIGDGKPVIQWDGSAGQNMFLIRDSSSFTFRDLIFLGKTGASPAAFINFDSTGAGTEGTNEHMVIDCVRMGRNYTQDGSTGLGAAYGIYLGGSENADNDQFCFSRSQIYDCTVAAIAILNNQSIWGRITDFHLDTCAVGLWSASNLQCANLQFNRNTVCDLKIENDTEHKVVGFNSENAKLLIDQYSLASLFVDGGKALINPSLMTGDYWANFSALDECVLENWNVIEEPPTKKIYVKTGNASSGRIYIRNCTLPNGGSSSGYVLDAPGTASPASGAMPIFYDIEHGQFKVRGRIDLTKTLDLASIADNGTNFEASMFASSSSGTVLGDFIVSSLGVSISGLLTTNGMFADYRPFTRFVNKTGGVIDLASTKLRYRKLVEEIRQNTVVTHDVASAANGAGSTFTTAVACQFGDFVIVSCATNATYQFLTSANVSAANEVKIRFQNESGGTVNPASADYNVAILREELFNAVGASIISPGLIAAGDQISFDVPIVGASLGDFVFCAYGADLQGLTQSVAMHSDGVARVTFYNGTGSSITPDNSYLKVGALTAL